LLIFKIFIYAKKKKKKRQRGAWVKW
jgi:hypothetical protein